MTFAPAPSSLVDLFKVCLPQRPGVSTRKMFSYPAAFANTWMFAGVFQDSIFARLPPSSPTRESFAPFAPMTGRPMRELWILSEEILDDEDQLAAILDEARRYVESLPPKPDKGKTKTRI